MKPAKWAILLLMSVLIIASVVYGQSGVKKPRVFVTDSNSWEIMGGFTANRNYAQGGVAGGARPQTAEIIKTLGERCPDCIVTINKDRADYILILEHEGGKGVVRKDNKFALFNKNGDAIKSGSTRSLGNSVKDVCKALTNDWRENRTSPSNTMDKETATGAPDSDSSVSAPSVVPANGQAGDRSVGTTMQSAFDQMAANAHNAAEPQPQRNTGTDQKTEQTKQSTTNDHKAWASTSEQRRETSRRTGQETTVELGNADSFLFARILTDHFLRAAAERKNDAEGYYKLKKSGKLYEVRNHSNVRIINSAKDADGFDIYEVTILATGKTVWIESKFIR